MEREKIKNDLLNAEFTDVQGETLSYIFAEMATKDDVRMLSAQLTGEMKAFRSETRGEMKAFRSELRGEMKAFRSELRGEMNAMGGRLETRISDESRKTQRFMMTLIVALGVILGAFNFAAALVQ